MAETQVGVAKIFGLGSAALATLAGACTLTIEDTDGGHEFEIERTEGQDGEIENMCAWGEKLTLSMNFVPKAATRALAYTELAKSKPGLLAKVVISAHPITLLNGDYNYIGGWTVKNTKKGLAVVGIKLEANIANRTSLTAAVLVG